ncbi:MAG TPA: hypothetical protein VFX60_00100 [Micromonospora sp.]|nr:hypothetical protein [Micromonospora sp.]
MTTEPPRFAVQLIVRMPDLAAATVLARAIARSLAFLPELEPGDTTVSLVGDGVPHRVFCNRRLADDLRCARLTNHAGRCRPPICR